MSEFYNDELSKDEEKTKRNPVRIGVFVALIVILAIQLGTLTFAILYQPKPKDEIVQYYVDVTPQSNGTLDVSYYVLWRALDKDEPLTYVDIGLPNGTAVLTAKSCSRKASMGVYSDYGYYSMRCVLLTDAHQGDEILMTFTVNVGNLLYHNENGYFYEFVPSWFNAVDVLDYKFTWHGDGVVSSNGTKNASNNYVWQGSITHGTYVMMNVQYSDAKFDNVAVNNYVPFDDSGVVDDLKSDKTGAIVAACFFGCFLIVPEILIIDNVVSFFKGRGFVRSGGYYMHVNGRVNPNYTRYVSSSSGGSGGGGHSSGCACACACACAGGGRAGCSQKDTYKISEKE